jgi:hydroxyacylglutathione hydrolase
MMPTGFLPRLSGDRLTVTHIINTHGHFDHVGANKRLKEVTGADILIHSADAPMLSQLSATAAAWGLAADRFTGGGPAAGGRGYHHVRHPHPDRAFTHAGHTPGGIGLYTEYTEAGALKKAVFRGRHPFCRLHRQNRFSRRQFRHPDQQHSASPQTT